MNFKILPIILLMASMSQVQGQITQKENATQISEQQSGNYTLQGIVVDGVKKYTPEQILKFTGLYKGEAVEIPGQRISNAIKKLWDTNSFSKVEVYVESVNGEQVVLGFFNTFSCEFYIFKFLQIL